VSTSPNPQLKQGVNEKVSASAQKEMRPGANEVLSASGFSLNLAKLGMRVRVCRAQSPREISSIHPPFADEYKGDRSKKSRY
jgi:hypothetical protein